MFSMWCHFLLIHLNRSRLQVLWSSQICRHGARFHSDCSLHLAPKALGFIGAESLLANGFDTLANSSKYMPTPPPPQALHHYVRYYQQALHSYESLLISGKHKEECLKSGFALKLRWALSRRNGVKARVWKVRSLLGAPFTPSIKPTGLCTSCMLYFIRKNS